MTANSQTRRRRHSGGHLGLGLLIVMIAAASALAVLQMTGL